MAVDPGRETIRVQSERAVLAAVRLPGSVYDRANPFAELRALAEQAGAIVVGQLEQHLPRPVAGTFMGAGKVAQLRHLAEMLDASTIIFDHDLSPRQIANLEQATGRKVVDRSELILDIFAARATTHEARLQVELAQLEYTYPRLRAMWDHLERIVGAGGVRGIGTRGPGEQQLEIDRRLVQRRREDLRRQLARIQARKRREVRRRNAAHFTVGLVGYTNAGKSTLFNALTAGGAYADDRPFATLLTRTRHWAVGPGVSVMLSDTVGFVRDLPHHLIASFRATLEEATHADLLLVVLDVSDPAADLHYQTVMRTLDDLLADVAARDAREGQAWHRPELILLLNKVDRLRDNRDVLVWTGAGGTHAPLPTEFRGAGSLAYDRRGAISGPDGETPSTDPPGMLLPGVPRQVLRHVPGPLAAIPIVATDRSHPGHARLRTMVLELARGPLLETSLMLPLADARAISLVEAAAEAVLDRAYHPDHVLLRVRIGERALVRLRAGGLLPANGCQVSPASAGGNRTPSPCV